MQTLPATQRCKQSLMMQLRLAVKSGNTLKQREYLWRSAEVFDRLGEFTDAEEQLKALLEMDLTKDQYLETLCHLADLQVSCGCSASSHTCCIQPFAPSRTETDPSCSPWA